MSENFLGKLIEDDLSANTFPRPICTRFPPEPNGYLHIGSLFAVHTNYMIAQKYRGHFNLRFDDTNPLKEDMKYVNAIIEDIDWLGYNTNGRVFYGSDYSEEIFEAALTLIKKGKAYVCDLSPEEITEYRGTLTEGGKNSPYRNRSVAENVGLFMKMKNGEFANASKVLRAKIDMSSPNITLRDPVLYRIIHAPHYRTGDSWCIYPLYDFAHPIQDAIEGITHSLCSNEFLEHRPLYEWVLRELDIADPPKQREFGRVNVTGVVTSKRYLRELVTGAYVDGWDDPRLPTIRGLRRRGFTPSSIKSFIEEIGIPKQQTFVDMGMLEQSLRADLKAEVVSKMAVLNPLKVVITNYPEGHIEPLPVKNNSENGELGNREVPFSKVIYIESDDFMEVPIPGFKRLTLGTEVRLMGAYFIKCHDVIKDEATGNIRELHCTYDPETKSGTGFKGRKVKGTIHWVSAEHGIKADVHLYNRLIITDEIGKDKGKPWEEKLNPESLVILKDCMIESSVKDVKQEEKFQFIRHGYFCVDTKYTTKVRLVFNRIVPLKDSWKR
ncbi:MAG: glutamine--tRNA ligase/YqeY domain fusion protein [Anaerobacillus sp.]|uniref:glutamine--tRNA ligase/YqeY domain fusion protein n=1 Tax=Anaerobacillus sp. TaxID=1872506 RepID=UPI00391A5EF0